MPFHRLLASASYGHRPHGSGQAAQGDGVLDVMDPALGVPPRLRVPSRPLVNSDGRERLILPNTDSKEGAKYVQVKKRRACLEGIYNRQCNTKTTKPKNEREAGPAGGEGGKVGEENKKVWAWGEVTRGKRASSVVHASHAVEAVQALLEKGNQPFSRMNDGPKLPWAGASGMG